MKTLFNLTTGRGDLGRFASREHFLSVLSGFDGVELMVLEEDRRQIVPKEKAVGLHMTFPAYWLDFWNGDHDRVRQEFFTPENACAHYGGRSRDALIRQIRADLAHAGEYGAEYMVFHAMDGSASECMTARYAHSDEEVIDALCELLNEALPNDPAGPLLLLENLWEPGLRFTRPEITERLLRGIRYPNTGLMLDTGHLMHTEPRLRTQKEALFYIHRCLDQHGELCRYIRGIHLHQSLSGAYIRRVQKAPPAPPKSYEERMEQLFSYVFQVDRHRPFVCPGVGGLVDRIQPDYLTFEFISNDLPELQAMLRRQKRALSS